MTKQKSISIVEAIEKIGVIKYLSKKISEDKKESDESRKICSEIYKELSKYD